MTRIVIFGLLLLAGTAHAAGEKLLFYKAQKGAAEVYLLGSMHLARADIYPLRQEITQAFEASDVLAVELDISGANQLLMQSQLLSRGMYPPGESIRDHLSPGTWRELEGYLGGTGMPPEMLARMRPGLLVTTLSSMEMLKLGLSPEQGVDLHFLNRARGSKPVHELETVEQQISLLLDFPEGDLLVRQTLAQIDDMENLMNQLVSSWKRGDAGALQKLVLDDELRRHPEFRSIHERMFDQRNRDMTRQVEGFLRSGQRYFVVVGAGHLVGDQGIVAMLQRRGYKPQQL